MVKAKAWNNVTFLTVLLSHYLEKTCYEIYCFVVEKLVELAKCWSKSTKLSNIIIVLTREELIYYTVGHQEGPWKTNNFTEEGDNFLWYIMV